MAPETQNAPAGARAKLRDWCIYTREPTILSTPRHVTTKSSVLRRRVGILRRPQGRSKSLQQMIWQGARGREAG